MSENSKIFGMNVKYAAAAMAALVSFAGAAMGGTVQMANKRSDGVNAATVAEGKYYCNTKALSAAEQARHETLTKKLLAVRKETVETEKGYEFQYSPADVTVAEVAEWVVAESKCCPFFDFHIDLEEQGRLVCLRLTGADGVKQFIRAEFGLK